MAANSFSSVCDRLEALLLLPLLLAPLVVLAPNSEVNIPALLPMLLIMIDSCDGY
jgi:hypothetical protein